MVRIRLTRLGAKKKPFPIIYRSKNGIADHGYHWNQD